MTTTYRFFISVTPGLEELLESELERLALPLRLLERSAGGLEVTGDRRALWQVCRHSRLAEGVRVRVGRPFVARDFEALIRAVERLPWHAFLRRDEAVPPVRAHCERSRLYHSDAVAERVSAAITARLRSSVKAAAEADAPIYVRISADTVQLSVDAVGAPLHRRGYRTHVGAAPLRETLAAACVAATGYRGERVLWDPFCGAGTLPLEAALSAWGGVAGQGRRFAFERWPSHDDADYIELLASTVEGMSAAAVALIGGSDRDPRALAAALHNAAKAGLSGALRWQRAEVAEVAAQLPRGALLLCNPPYGERVGRGATLARTYRELNQLVSRRPDLDAYVLTGSPLLTREARGLPWQRRLEFRNRGLAVRLYHREGA